MIRSFRILVVVAIVAVVAAYFFPRNEAPQPQALVEIPLAKSSPGDQSGSSLDEKNPPPAVPDSASAKHRDDGLNFTTQSLSGGKINLSQYRGHPVIVDFWATWCSPCRRQIPELNTLYKKYNKSRGLVVLGISCDMIEGRGLQSVEPFVEEFQIDYPIALADQALLDGLGVEAIPTTLFVDKDGKIVARILGAGRSGEISKNTMLLLDGGDKSGHVADL
ncbi:MAG: TlpA disulfide reductase family protein [Candidatus Binatus sp.]|uniref:TlpA disulfide reductase family protein n=1 Tax=Candidatus Binatus sp. TaxID=2811406 RepID=UPI00271C3CA2|nr:TlpA disulfide reductase family protein [Candidatus Binatus sp.]MDO8434791.1 TlpA disulfide reductase family protein [Candidatus Binatus sp.]